MSKYDIKTDKADKTDMKNKLNKSELTNEVWKFTLEDESTVNKKVALWNS